MMRASPQSGVPFNRIKYQVEGYLRESSLSYTIFRPATYMDLWAQMIVEQILRQGRVMVFGSGQNPINFADVADVARLVGMALDDCRALNQTIDMVGPEELTLNQVIAIFTRLRGQPVKVQHVPVTMMRVMSVLMRVANPISHL